MADVKKITTLLRKGKIFMLVTKQNARVKIPEGYRKVGKTFLGDFSRVKNPSDSKFVYQTQ